MESWKTIRRFVEDARTDPSIPKRLVVLMGGLAERYGELPILIRFIIIENRPVIDVIL